MNQFPNLNPVNPSENMNPMNPPFDSFDYEPANFSQQQVIQFNQTAVPYITPPGFQPPMPSMQSSARGIRNCIGRTTYIWLHNRSGFWFIPIFVSRQSIMGFRWNQFRWEHSVIFRRSIRSFQCF